MQRVLNLEYDEIVFGMSLDSFRFSYAKKIPLFYTISSIQSPPIYDFVDPTTKRKEYDDLFSRISLLGLVPIKNAHSARLEDNNTLKITTLQNLVVNVKFNKLWLVNSGALILEGMPPEYEIKDQINIVADTISVRSGLYHDYWELDTDGDDFVKKIVFELSTRFYYKNIDNKKDCIALSYLKQEDMGKFDCSEIAARMKTAHFMEKAGIKGRWDKTNNCYKKIKLESCSRFVYPIYTLEYKDLPKNIELLYNVPAPIIREDLYGEIQKIQVQSN